MNMTSPNDSRDCGYGCKNVVAAMDRLTSHMCESKETSTRVVLVFTCILLIQFAAFVAVCIYMIRHAPYTRHRHSRKDETKKKLVDEPRSDCVVAEIDDAEL